MKVDFDDGHCPTWRNQIVGLYNVYRAVHGKIDGIGDVSKCPILMLRPRAWNMTEHNVFVNTRINRLSQIFTHVFRLTAKKWRAHSSILQF